MPVYSPTLFPATRAHEGRWEGTYTHINDSAEIEDQHSSVVHCLFPDDGGEVFYRQEIIFTWPDGRKRHDVFEGVPRGDALWYRTPTFEGKSWETDDGIILLSLNRLDEPGARFFEMIVMGESGEHRARTWHWFRNGRLYRRTLCDERRVA
ncbi:MAG: hypothetical protein AAF830_01285 [Pseudomonadota bacterium]